MAQSDDADRPPSAVDTLPASSPICFIDQLSIPEKDGSGLSKRQPCVYRSSAVSSAQALPTHAASAHHQRPAGPCPNTPDNHLGDTESGLSPAGGPTLHHRPLPRLVRFPGAWPVPTSVQPAQLYSCAIQQRHRPTPAHNVPTGRRPTKTTPIDRPARSSGRRGRGFKSRHPDALKRQVTGPHVGKLGMVVRRLRRSLGE